MIVSDLALKSTAKSGSGPRTPYEQLFVKDEPAEVHLLVRLLSPIAEPEQELVGALQFQQKERKVKRTSDDTILMTEVERLNIRAERAATFHRFEHVFTLNSYHFLLRVTFFVNLYDAGTYSEQAVGSAKVWLEDVVSANNETLKVELVPADGTVFSYKEAEFSLDWSTISSSALSMEVRMRASKTTGWIFTTTRMFFVVFGWESRGTTWTPLYRSEVLSKPSEFLNGKSEMVFQLAEAYLNKVNGALENRPLRIEFFHMDSEDVPKLLAFLSTSLKSLRRAKESTKLDWRLNAFQQGEVTGTLTMGYSKVTHNRHFFVLHADFGGKVKDDFIYFALTLTEHRKQSSFGSFRSLKPFYNISRPSSDGKWECVYRSEAQMQVMGKHSVKFQLAKLTEGELNMGWREQPLCISFSYKRVVGKDIRIGSIETSVATLFDYSAGTMLPLTQSDSSGKGKLAGVNGYVVIGQPEENGSALFFPAHCVLGQSAPESSMLSATAENMDLEIPSESTATP